MKTKYIVVLIITLLIVGFIFTIWNKNDKDISYTLELNNYCNNNVSLTGDIEYNISIVDDCMAKWNIKQEKSICRDIIENSMKKVLSCYADNSEKEYQYPAGWIAVDTKNGGYDKTTDECANILLNSSSKCSSAYLYIVKLFFNDIGNIIGNKENTKPNYREVGNIIKNFWGKILDQS